MNFELISFAAASAWLDEIEAANRAGKLHCGSTALPVGQRANRLGEMV